MKGCMLYDSINAKFPEQKNPYTQKVVAVRSWEKGGGEQTVTTHRQRVSFLGDLNVLELGSGDGCTALGMY